MTFTAARTSCSAARIRGSNTASRACGSASCFRTSRGTSTTCASSTRCRPSRTTTRPASYQLHTGDVRAGKASLGSWVTYGLGTENQDLPGYVVLFDAGPLGGAANYSNGFLPAAFQPTRLRDKGTPVLDLLPPDEFAAGQRASLDLIRELNLRHRDDARRASPSSRPASRATNWPTACSRAALEVGNLDARDRSTRSAATASSTTDERTAQLRPQVPAGPAAGRARRAVRAALRHARQGRLGRARQARPTTTRRGPAGPISRSPRCWPT